MKTYFKKTALRVASSDRSKKTDVRVRIELHSPANTIIPATSQQELRTN